jgi:hypothetical protein
MFLLGGEKGMGGNPAGSVDLIPAFGRVGGVELVGVGRALTGSFLIDFPRGSVGA